ncbi:uncharacterized protein J4E84_007444 [Alternaria hordeiaustralica]|uniref:uncharacterized protein n=1 Tax=Alternaria hordeiaustralica TaxID=1187925 RepID=UPI0020C2BDF5|nr:uncharacterized protein J4E84_007444 [Alternaria hordeiaustralica]KAI4681847.1 hypothetical protein J4E84_007444 [Alternaria hordeiaustralica]
MYLPLADATVITFLSPSLACWACSYFINEPFTRMEQIAAYISLFGVVLIARPQFLLAAGLQYEKSSRATNMLYMQMFFALGFDKLIWGTTPSALSIVGSSLILGSAIYVAMNKEEPKKALEPMGRGDSEEERGLMSPVLNAERRDDEDADIQMRPLR